MAKVRKDYWSEAELLSHVQAALATRTETVTEALNRVVEGEKLTRVLKVGRGAFPNWIDSYHDDRSRLR